MYYESKWNTTCINNIKNVFFSFTQGIRFKIISFTPTVTEVILRGSDLSTCTTFKEINIRVKSTFRAFTKIIRILASGMTFRLPVIRCPAVWKTCRKTHGYYTNGILMNNNNNQKRFWNFIKSHKKDSTVVVPWRQMDSASLIVLTRQKS